LTIVHLMQAKILMVAAVTSPEILHCAGPPFRSVSDLEQSRFCDVAAKYIHRCSIFWQLFNS
jgi:hypothetical protein